MAGTKLADLSLQITPCKEDEKKKWTSLTTKNGKNLHFTKEKGWYDSW
jgi:hypothetical protein